VVAKEAKEVEEVVNLMEAVEGHQVEAHPGQSMPALNLDLD
jgi:hypothetical protein